MRALLAAVIGMGVLIVIGTTVLIVEIGEKLSGGGVVSDAPVVLQEPPGSRVVSAASDGKTLTLVLAGPGGQEIEVRDLNSGAVVRRFDVSGK